MAPTRGILYVTMQPKDGLHISQFHDWYNNEHGPTRLRLPYIENGFRYKLENYHGPEDTAPPWMACYDISDMAELTKEPYTRLRTDAVKSQREKDTMKQITVGRKLLDLVGSHTSKNFQRLEDVKSGASRNIMFAESLSIESRDQAKLEKWCTEDYVPAISKISGWTRTRQYVTSSVDKGARFEYLILHEFRPGSNVNGDDYKTLFGKKNPVSSLIEASRIYAYTLSYTFGPAPRHLPDISNFGSPDGRTRTFSTSAGEGGAIESWVTTRDGVDLEYRLEGSRDSEAPVIVLSNSILVNWGIWDNFVKAFLSTSTNSKFRIARYQTRGRSSQCGETPVTLDLLASDIIALLDALRVPKAAAVIGVSLGGATALDVALNFPHRVASFVSCDTNANAPATNSKAWGERIDMAEKEGAVGNNGEKVVGSQLAEATVRRWFVKESYDRGSMEKEIDRVKAMVASNSLEGFKKSVRALYEYDMREAMIDCNIQGAFVVGGGDGVLPKTMKEMAANLGGGVADYHIVDGAGHLPMVERPIEVAAIVTSFLDTR